MSKKDLERVAEGFKILNFVLESIKEIYKEPMSEVFEYLRLKYFYACHIMNIVRIFKYLVMKDFYDYYVISKEREEKGKQSVEDNDS